MAWSSRIIRLLESPWRRLLAFWVKPRMIEPAPNELSLVRELPTFYVLPHPALSDAWLLAELCKRHGVPSPDDRIELSGNSQRALLSLPPRGRRLWPDGSSRTPFLSLIEFLIQHPEADLQLIPVSIFWGRAPGKRFGLWKTLAADSWQFTGRLRRVLAILVNGKSVEVHFGAPLRLRELIDGRPGEVINHKAARLLRVHFRGMRTRVLGPDLSHRRMLVDGVVTSPAVRQAIDDVASEERRAPQHIKKRARRYGLEIASNMSYPVLRFMDQLLRRLWNRLYDGVDVRGLSRVKPLAGDHTLIYIPCHRSHIDYLLLSYVLYREGLMPPHVAAGRNLDMPLIGGLLRRGGAFFLRRSFKDNRLYGAVFNEYLHRLLSRGHPLEYFIEGGRSRSGRMLTPRPGMLAMTLRSYLRNPGHKISFVPVYIGYERILEIGSYQQELQGKKKHKESPLDLLRIRKKLRQPFGRVAVNIGEILPLDAFLDREVPEWRQQAGPRPAWMAQAVPRLGDTLAQRINAAAALNAINLVGLVILATPHHTIEYDLLTRQLALLVALQRERHDAPHISLPEGEPPAWIERAVELGMIARRDQALGELVAASPEQAGLLSWYRNNVLHLFALPALVAFAFRNNTSFTLQTLLQHLISSWPILSRELYVLPIGDLPRAVADALGRLEKEGLLTLRDDTWHKPDSHQQAHEHLWLLGQLAQPSLERGYLLLVSLLSQPSGALSRETLVQQARLLAERLSLLSGLDAPEYFDTRLFSGLVDTLEAEGWVWQANERLCYGDTLIEASQQAQELFDPALRQRLHRITTSH